VCYLSVVEARRRLMILQQTLIDISRNDGGKKPGITSNPIRRSCREAFLINVSRSLMRDQFAD